VRSTVSTRALYGNFKYRPPFPELSRPDRRGSPGSRKADPVDDTHHRAVHAQTTVSESRHALGRHVFHGRRGQLFQAYRDGQEDQLGALGLVINAIVLWNTRYLDAIITTLGEAGYPLVDEAIAKLSPLLRKHINVHGTYTFSPVLLGGALRPLREPRPDDEDEL